MKAALVCGAGGFIGSHMVKRLKAEGFSVRAVDLKHPEFSPSPADEFILGDLRDRHFVDAVMGQFDEVYQFAADMGGAGYLFTGDRDADIVHNSAAINLNVIDACAKNQVGRIFYSSSACVYPRYNQEDPQTSNCAEDTVYPADPDSDYGFEKLFSERLYRAYERNYTIPVRIARYHNIFGPEGTWQGGKEKAPAAICRKVAETTTGEIEIWGDGEQTRSFLYIDDCIEGTIRLMRSNVSETVNIGSEHPISINNLARGVAAIAGKDIHLRHVDGPLGVRGRNSDNRLIGQLLGWRPTGYLWTGIEKTYRWIENQIILVS